MVEILGGGGRGAELAIIILYPTSASGIIVLLNITTKKSLNPADLVIFSFPPYRTLTIFVRHGIMVFIKNCIIV